MQRNLDDAISASQREEGAAGAHGEHDIVVAALGNEHPGRHRGEGLLSSNRNRMLRHQSGGSTSSASSAPSSGPQNLELANRIGEMMAMFSSRFDQQDAIIKRQAEEHQEFRRNITNQIDQLQVMYFIMSY